MPTPSFESSTQLDKLRLVGDIQTAVLFFAWLSWFDCTSHGEQIRVGPTIHVGKDSTHQQYTKVVSKVGMRIGVHARLVRAVVLAAYDVDY